MPSPHPPCLWQCDSRVPSQSGAGREVIPEILRQLEGQHWDSRDLFAVHLALEEALANAIKHGNHGDSHKRVEILCRLAAHLLRVEVADEGLGFNPEAIPDPTEPEQMAPLCGRRDHEHALLYVPGPVQRPEQPGRPGKGPRRRIGPGGRFPPETLSSPDGESIIGVHLPR